MATSKKAATRVAIVTGATKGIGRAIAQALVEAGTSVTITARTEADVHRVTEELAERAPEKAAVLGVPGDVSDYDHCRNIVARTVDHFGRLDILVNNAGVGGFANIEEMTVERWRTVMGTNLDSLFYCCHEAIPQLKRTGGGWIINIGSLAGKNAFPGGAAYNASKFGLIGFSEALMQEVRYDGIRVSYIMPGSVATEFEGSSHRSGDWMIQPEDIAQIVLDLLVTPERTLPSRIEVRPSKPKKK